MNAPHDKPRVPLNTAISSSDVAPSEAELAGQVEQVGLAEAAKAGLLVVGHGTRDRAGVEEFHATVQRIAARVAMLPSGPAALEGCFLELAEPTIDAAVERFAAAGVGRITVAPLILFAAGHAKRDIPDAVAAAAARHALTVERHLPHLGCRPELVALSARRFREATHDLKPVADGETLLLLVGRGSRDDEATAEMHRFARLRADATPVGRLEVAFTAMAEPKLDQAIEAVARLSFRRIVVQPHLLFAGELLDRVRATVERASAEHPDRQWVFAGHLGPEPEIAEAVCANLTRL